MSFFWVWYNGTMTKLKAPLLSLEAHRTLGDSLTFQKRRGVSFVRQKPIPSQPNSLSQSYHRWLYQDYVYLWHALSAAAKAQWAAEARPFRLTGFNYYMSQKLLTLPDIAGMWYLDEIVGGTTPDSSENTNTGTVYGASVQGGRIHQSLSFDGLNDRVQIPYSSSLAITDAITLEAFVYIVASGAHGLICKRIQGIGSDWQFILNADDTIACDVNFPVAGWVSLDGVTPLSHQTWHHVAFTYDRSFLRLFSDGQPDGAPVAHTEVLPTNSIPLTLARYWIDAYCFEGRLDHAVIWSTALPLALLKVHSERRWPS